MTTAGANNDSQQIDVASIDATVTTSRQHNICINISLENSSDVTTQGVLSVIHQSNLVDSRGLNGPTVITHLSLYHNCDSSTIRLRRKIDMFFFARVESRRMEQARAILRSRIVVVSQSNRNCNHGITQSLTHSLTLNQSINQSINQSVSQSVSQSVRQPASQPASYSTNQSISQSVKNSIFRINDIYCCC